MQSLGTKKHNLLGPKKSRTLSGQIKSRNHTGHKKITQPTGTKKLMQHIGTQKITQSLSNFSQDILSLPLFSFYTHLQNLLLIKYKKAKRQGDSAKYLSISNIVAISNQN